MRFGYGLIGWQGQLHETFRTIADLGFEGVEMFDLLDRLGHGVDVGRMLADAGLKLTGTYFGGSFVQEDLFPGELSDFEQTVRAVAELGGRHVIVGGGRLRRETRAEDFSLLTRNLDTLGRAARNSGVQLGLHPHLGMLVYTPDEIASAMAATDPDLVKLAPDIAHLARGGADPMQFLRQYIDRIVYVHLKDLFEGEFAELGQGKLPIVEFCRVLAERGYDGWATVELDASEDPAASARVNATFVREHLAGAVRPRRPR